MRPIAFAILLTFTLSGIAAAGDGAAYQPPRPSTGKVTVYRGDQAASSSPVAVYRGNAAPPAHLAAPPARPVRPARGLAAAGERLWLVEPGEGRLTACELRGTSTVGRRRVACRTRDLPAD